MSPSGVVCGKYLFGRAKTSLGLVTDKKNCKEEEEEHERKNGYY